MGVLEIILKIGGGGKCEHFPEFRGFLQGRKSPRKPANSLFIGKWSHSSDSEVLSKRGNKHTSTLNNTELGAGWESSMENCIFLLVK